MPTIDRNDLPTNIDDTYTDVGDPGRKAHQQHHDAIHPAVRDDTTPFAKRLTRTPVKTANYTAAAGDLVPVDTTSGPVTVTLPAAPAAGTRVGVKLVVGATNAVTIARGGTDVFNVTGGPTSFTLSVVNTAVILQYDTGGIWTVITALPTAILTAFLLTTARGAANGVASLDSGGTVPDAQIPATIARDAEVSSSVAAAVAALVNSAPGTLDTLGELAAALQSDESVAAALATKVAGKVNYAVHGATAGTARPAAATVVLWIGSVNPTNAAANDFLWHTTNKLLYSYTGSAWDQHGSGTYVALAPAPSGDVTGATDTPLLQAAITAAASGTTLQLRDGHYYINAELLFDSGVTIRGNPASIIEQVTDGAHGLVSRNYRAASGVSPSGRANLVGFRVILPIGSAGHAVLLRDFWSLISGVETSGGTDPFFLTHLNDGGSAVGGTLVENDLFRCTARSFAGVGYSLGAANNAKLTDGNVSMCRASAGASATVYLQIGSAAGWSIDTFHGYGAISSHALSLANAFNLNVDNIYIETFGTSAAAIRLGAVQQAVNIDNVVVMCPNAATDAVLSVTKSGSYSAPRVNVGNLHVVQANAQDTYVVSNDDTATHVRIGRLTVEGAGEQQVYLATGTGSPTVLDGPTRITTGSYLVPPSVAGAGTPLVAASTMQAVPLLVPSRTKFSAIGLKLTAAVASSVVRVGIYKDLAGKPGALIAEAGTIDTSSTTGALTVNFPTPVVIAANTLVWVAYVQQGGASAVSAVGKALTNGGVSGWMFSITDMGFMNGGNSAQSATSVPGALPAAFGTVTTASGGISVGLKAA